MIYNKFFNLIRSLKLWLVAEEKVLLKNRVYIALGVWVALEFFYNLLFWDSKTPAPLIIEAQFVVLLFPASILIPQFIPILFYYFYTLLSQVLILYGFLDNQIILFDYLVYGGTLIFLIYLVLLKGKKWGL